jgi:hypothetical protein
MRSNPDPSDEYRRTIYLGLSYVSKTNESVGGLAELRILLNATVKGKCNDVNLIRR